MQLTPAARSQLGFASADPFQYGLCLPGRLVIRVSTCEDMGGRTFLFEPTGDRYVHLAVYSAAGEGGGDRTLRDLVAAIDARWPGMRFQTALDLAPPLKRERRDMYACRTKVVRRDYQECLGPRSDVRKETLFVHSETADGLRLQSVMQQFAAANTMAFTPDANKRQARHHRACVTGKALIVADIKHWAGWPPGQEGHKWGMLIDTWVPTDDGDSAALIDDLAATLEAEWPGVLRSRPDLDFCRAARVWKQRDSDLVLAFFHMRTYREHGLGRGPCSTCFHRPSEDSPSRRH
jgi:hypothetical protein